VDAVAAAQIRTRDKFEIGEIDVQLVAIHEAERVTRGHRPVRIFPELDVQRAPGESALSLADLHVDVAIGVDAQLANLALTWRDPSLLELRFLHPPGPVTRSAQSLVVGDIPFLEAGPSADVVTAAETTRVGTSEIFRCLSQSESRSEAIDLLRGASHALGEHGGPLMRVEFPHNDYLVRGPDAAVRHGVAFLPMYFF